jgi:hypothetical protein
MWILCAIRTRCYVIKHIMALKVKQDRQCVWNVIKRRVYETIVAVKKHQILNITFCACVCMCACVGVWVGWRVGVRACSLPYPACKANLLPFWLHPAFRHYLIKGTILGKTLPYIKCAFRFPLHILSKTFRILRRTRRDIVSNVITSSFKVPFILVGF